LLAVMLVAAGAAQADTPLSVSLESHTAGSGTWDYELNTGPGTGEFSGVAWDEGRAAIVLSGLSGVTDATLSGALAGGGDPPPGTCALTVSHTATSVTVSEGFSNIYTCSFFGSETLGTLEVVSSVTTAGTDNWAIGNLIGNVEASGTVQGPGNADLSITNTDGKTTYVPGTTNTYTIVVSNGGPLGVTGAMVTDTFPAAIVSPTWTAVESGGATGYTASGSGSINDTVNMPLNSTITYTVTAPISASATGDLTDAASVAPPAGVGDPNFNNNTATDTDTPSDFDLALSVPSDKTVNATSPSGATVTYAATASDADDSSAPPVNCVPGSGSIFAIKTTTVTCTASDSDDSPTSVTKTFTITVQGAKDQLTDLANRVNGVGPGTSLADNIASVQSDLAANDTGDACGTLNAFIHEVKAQTGTTIKPATLAQSLIGDAQRIEGVIPCPS
jgi:uncharacterized repeat protein (TIGR01451 family)